MDTYALVGYPLGHSFSRNYFTRFFEEQQLDAQYINFELPHIDLLPETIDATPTLRGFNVTIPYKQQVIPYLDAIDDTAAGIGAVNVVRVIHREGDKPFLKGYNTDVIGFTESLRPLLKPHHTAALILGTGGASKAVHYALTRLGIACHFVSRTPKAGQYSYDALTPEVMTEHLLIVNTSPVGMYPHTDECPRIPYDLLNSQHLLFDLVYNPEKTLFLQCGERAGATICNGMQMLIGQAQAAWRIWNDNESVSTVQ